MTIACTRCGAKQEGDIILPNIAFKFKHIKGCGWGLGPLAIIPSAKKMEKLKIETIETSNFTTTGPNEIIVEVKEPKGEKTKVFGNTFSQKD